MHIDVSGLNQECGGCALKLCFYMHLYIAHHLKAEVTLRELDWFRGLAREKSSQGTQTNSIEILEVEFHDSPLPSWSELG